MANNSNTDWAEAVFWGGFALAVAAAVVMFGIYQIVKLDKQPCVQVEQVQQ